MQALLRFLEFVRRELEADDVRGEIGGRAPSERSGAVLWATTSGGIRVVATFDQQPADLEDKRERLRSIVESFASVAALVDESRPPAPARSGVAQELDEALAVLAQRARASAALVIDDSSPVIWGGSVPPSRMPEDVHEAMWIARIARAVQAAGHDLAEIMTAEGHEVRSRLAEAGLGATEATGLARDVERVAELRNKLDRVQLTIARAIAHVRDREKAAHEAHRSRSAGEAQETPEVPLVMRPFANIYRLVLVFDGGISELHVESALIHALPVIERLVTSLPPRDPASGGAKVAVLRRLRSV